jgi:hypothetical protein
MVGVGGQVPPPASPIGERITPIVDAPALDPALGAEESTAVGDSLARSGEVLLEQLRVEVGAPVGEFPAAVPTATASQRDIDTLIERRPPPIADPLPGERPNERHVGAAVGAFALLSLAMIGLGFYLLAPELLGLRPDAPAVAAGPRPETSPSPSVAEPPLPPAPTADVPPDPSPPTTPTPPAPAPGVAEPERNPVLDDPAVRAAEAVAERRPDDASDMLVRVASAWLGDGRLDDAGVVLDRAIELDRQNPQAMVTLARYHLARGQPTEAVRWAEEAARRRPRRATYHVIHGAALRASGDAEGAREAYRRALREDPYNGPARAALGE